MVNIYVNLRVMCPSGELNERSVGKNEGMSNFFRFLFDLLFLALEKTYIKN